MDRGAGRNGPTKLKAPRPVVHDVCCTTQIDGHVDQLWHEAEREKAVRYRTAKRAFLLAPLNVDVDPLVIAGEVSEPVDHLLRDLELGSEVSPRARYLGVDRIYVFERNTHLRMMPETTRCFSGRVLLAARDVDPRDFFVDAGFAG